MKVYVVFHLFSLSLSLSFLLPCFSPVRFMNAIYTVQVSPKRSKKNYYDYYYNKKKCLLPRKLSPLQYSLTPSSFFLPLALCQKNSIFLAQALKQSNTDRIYNTNVFHTKYFFHFAPKRNVPLNLGKWGVLLVVQHVYVSIC